MRSSRAGWPPEPSASETWPTIDPAGNASHTALSSASETFENPHHALWMEATTLETALMQAYMAFKVADLSIAVGGSLVVAGAGIAATGSGSRRD